MPHSLLGRLTAVLALLLVAAVASGLVMFSLFEQSTAARIGQAGALAGQACGALARRYRIEAAARGWSAEAAEEPARRDDLGALVAGALADRPGIEGGLWGARAGPLAYAFPTYEGGGPKTDLPQAEAARIRAAAEAATAADAPRLARYDSASQALLVASCPLAAPGLAAWAMTRVHSFAGGYWQLAAGLAVLSLATAGAAALAAALALTWRRHVAAIERAFARAGDGELPRLPATGERELDRIVSAMNEAGARLAGSREEARLLSLRAAEAERLAAVGRVAAGVAHAIRNPIAAMRLRSETALRGGVERKDGALDLVIAQVDRLDLLVGRLLAVAERDPPRAEEVALGPFLDACAAAHGGAVEAAAGLASARFDPAQMHRALDALLGNALEAAAGRPVLLRAERDGDRLALTVSDDGPGPPEEIRRTLFEPFVTGHPERAGLGLSIVREAARAHGGEADWVRADGRTVFRIVIPCPAS